MHNAEELCSANSYSHLVSWLVLVLLLVHELEESMQLQVGT